MAGTSAFIVKIAKQTQAVGDRAKLSALNSLLIGVLSDSEACKNTFNGEANVLDGIDGEFTALKDRNDDVVLDFAYSPEQARLRKLYGLINPKLKLKCLSATPDACKCQSSIPTGGYCENQWTLELTRGGGNSPYATGLRFFISYSEEDKDKLECNVQRQQTGADDIQSYVFHSFKTTPPDCPQGMTSLWTGYSRLRSNHRVHGYHWVPAPSYGRDLSLCEEIPKKPTDVVKLYCPGGPSSCKAFKRPKYNSNYLTYRINPRTKSVDTIQSKQYAETLWASVAPQPSAFFRPDGHVWGTEGSKGDGRIYPRTDDKYQISRCRVCVGRKLMALYSNTTSVPQALDNSWKKLWEGYYTKGNTNYGWIYRGKDLYDFTHCWQNFFHPSFSHASLPLGCRFDTAPSGGCRITRRVILETKGNRITKLYTKHFNPKYRYAWYRAALDRPNRPARCAVFIKKD